MDILLVEDNLVIQKIESALIVHLGYRAIIAATGELALIYCEQQRFDLILMDMQLPGIDGIETTRRLRAKGIKTPIVAITGNDTIDDKNACRSAGMNGFLVKPIKKEQLTSVIERFLSVNPYS